MKKRMMAFGLGLLCAVCCLVAGCGKEMPETDLDQHIIFWENQFRKGDDLWYVIYGTNDRDGVEELAFALFESGDMQNPPSNDRRVVTKRTDLGRNSLYLQEGFLVNNKNELIQLPTESQLYEIVKGKIVPSSQRVTLEQIRQYIESDPDEYTVASLLEFEIKESEKQ